MESNRLPGKALLLIDNIPLIIHTYKRAMLSSLKDNVYVCTHSKEIIDICKKYGANFIITGSLHINGTERIAEASRILKLNDSSIIVDVQGDEPLIDPKNIDRTLNLGRGGYDQLLACRQRNQYRIQNFQSCRH